MTALRLTKATLLPGSNSPYTSYHGPMVVSTTIWTDKEIEEFKAQLKQLINEDDKD